MVHSTIWYTDTTMCFSATASFAAGTALSVAGIETIKKARSKSEIPFAAIPLLFGVQQIIEGAVWLSLRSALPTLNILSTYTFILFAYVLWPILIPFSVLLLEVDARRKHILYIFQATGALVSLYLLYFIVSSEMFSQVVNKSIGYSMPMQYGAFLVTLYWLATCGSCLFSSHKIINILGFLATVSLAVAYYFYTASYVSVWCFFAAVLSGVVYWFFRRDNDHVE